MHAKVFSIQIFQHFHQIPPRVCTLVLFIIIVLIYTHAQRARDIGAPLLKIMFLRCRNIAYQEYISSYSYLGIYVSDLLFSYIPLSNNFLIIMDIGYAYEEVIR